jgi:hypothetical protein
MDPITILALAKGSYEAIKAGISVGKEMQGMFSDVMSLLDSANQLTRIAANPPRASLFDEKSAEQIAIEAFTAKSEVEQMMAEVRNAFLSEYGILAWDEILKETTRIRKEQAAARLKARKEQEELMQNIMVYGSAFLLLFVLIICGLLAAISFAN